MTRRQDNIEIVRDIMTDKNRSSFTHHEKLRYEYLLSNLQYLNEREKEEFNYLYAKMKAFLTERSQVFEASSPHSPVPQPVKRVSEPVKPDQVEEEIGSLPVHPAKKKKKVASSQKKRRPASASLSNIPSDKSHKSKKLPRKKGLLKTFFRLLMALVLLGIVGMGAMFVKGMNDVSSDKANFEPAVTEFFNGQDSPNGTNILILGSDQRVTEQSQDARADTIMVLNIGGKNKKMTLVSFMRDTLVNIPGVSYDDDYVDHKLNAAFTIGEQDDHQGAELIRQVLKSNFDIDVKYYIMIDFQTFATAVDSLFPNGVAINAEFSTVNGETVTSVEVPDDLNMANGVVPEQTITAGLQRMDGRTLLNYARFRKDDSGDFGRTKRQQQALDAILSQIKDPTKLFTGSEALGKIYALTSTNISYPFLLSQGLQSVATGQTKLEKVTIPANGDWYDEYDAYGGQALLIDFVKYQDQLKDLGLR